MKAASRVQCYDNRDAYFFCLGAPARPRARAPARTSRATRCRLLPRC